MTRPGFLRNPMPPAPDRPSGPVRCNSFALEAQGAPWRFQLQHDSEADVLLWITRGQGRVIVNGLRRGISMHGALFVPAGVLHAIDLPNTAQALLLQSPAGLSQGTPRAPLLLRVRESLAQAELTGAFDSMRRELSQDRPHLQDAMEAHVQLVSVWLRRQIAAGAEDRPEETAASRLVARYARAVAKRFREPAPMAAYAEALDVTPTHLTRTCRACCGLTAAEILTERKLHAARLALESPRPPVREVAQSLGFGSAAYFTRFIQSHTGQSPTDLRAAARTKQGPRGARQ